MPQPKEITQMSLIINRSKEGVEQEGPTEGQVMGTTLVENDIVDIVEDKKQRRTTSNNND